MTESLGRQLEQLVARLRAQQEELRNLDVSSQESREPVELDQSRVGRLSRMDALQQQAMAQATANRRSIELRKIDAALDRIADGDYGYCLRCGEGIAPERLDLDPATPLCIDCASIRRDDNQH
ncbi:TraR/DksA family transcriptional regulator [Limibacillus halophilus]|uniref:DnaK suppressor protein n=1 Tax=Limibacillus halophilus TaxID=1579333 RepID=A0A839SU19_9PROT|nr:TraR/DksA family transcriptional regulator [Limibacillus halophilus]MBB3064906.1 DnaK suppressor protein [Limibacillus halophilus]